MNTFQNAYQGKRRPGTIVMVIGIVAFGAYVFLSKQPASQRTLFEADANGKFRPVTLPSVQKTATPRLWKPEPQYIVERSENLGLSQPQAKQIKEISAKWMATKSRIESALNIETAFLESPKSERKSITGIQSDLSGYSELSRQYGAERDLAWSRAVAILSNAQRAQLEAINTKERSQ